MKDYNLQDPTDVDIMRSEFDFITEDEWEGYIELATEKKLGFKNINALRSAQKKAGIAKYVSAKMIKWVLRLVDQLEQGEEDDRQNRPTPCQYATPFGRPVAITQFFAEQVPTRDKGGIG